MCSTQKFTHRHAVFFAVIIHRKRVLVKRFLYFRRTFLCFSAVFLCKRRIMALFGEKRSRKSENSILRLQYFYLLFVCVFTNSFRFLSFVQHIQHRIKLFIHGGTSFFRNPLAGQVRHQKQRRCREQKSGDDFIYLIKVRYKINTMSMESCLSDIDLSPIILILLELYQIFMLFSTNFTQNPHFCCQAFSFSSTVFNILFPLPSQPRSPFCARFNACTL